MDERLLCNGVKFHNLPFFSLSGQIIHLVEGLSPVLFEGFSSQNRREGRRGVWGEGNVVVYLTFQSYCIVLIRKKRKLFFSSENLMAIILLSFISFIFVNTFRLQSELSLNPFSSDSISFFLLYR